MGSLLSPLIHNLTALSNNCLTNYDFGIYQQAIYDSFSYFNPNPFLSVRNVYALQDHFDPIFLLAGPWSALFNNSPYSLLIFEWFFVFITLTVLIYFSSDQKSALFWCFMLLWNRGLIAALISPIHPTTWAILPLTLLCIALKEEREKLFWVSFTSLLFFKEIFCLATLVLGITLLVKNNLRKGLIVCTISSLMILFNFKWRSILLSGETVHHGQALLLPFWEDFPKALMVFFERLEMGMYIKTLTVSFIPIVFLMIRKGGLLQKSFNRSDLFILSLWIPLLFIHTLFGRVGHQYGAILSFPPLLILWKNQVLLSSKGFKKILIVATLLTGLSPHIKTFTLLFNLRSYCEISAEKRAALRSIRQIIFNRPTKHTILSTEGSIPSILRPRAKIFHARSQHTQILPNYDLLLIGKKDNLVPFLKKEIPKIVEICRKSNKSRIIFDNDYFLLIDGPISLDCLHPLHTK